MNEKAKELIAKVREFEDTIAELTKPIEYCQFALEANAKNFADVLSDLTEQVKGFREQLESSEADEDKKFKRVELGQIYHFVNTRCGKFIVGSTVEEYSEYDNSRFENNNYFLTEDRAQEVADHLNKIMCFERVIDEFPEYEIKIDINAFVPNPAVSQKLRDRLKEKLNLTK